MPAPVYARNPTTLETLETLETPGSRPDWHDNPGFAMREQGIEPWQPLISAKARQGVCVEREVRDQTRARIALDAMFAAEIVVERALHTMFATRLASCAR